VKRLLVCLDLLRDKPGISTSEGQFWSAIRDRGFNSPEEVSAEVLRTIRPTTDWRSRTHDLKHNYGVRVEDFRVKGKPDKCWKLGESYPFTSFLKLKTLLKYLPPNL